MKRGHGGQRNGQKWGLKNVNRIEKDKSLKEGRGK